MRNAGNKEVFSKIYKNNSWGSKESVSGVGSEVCQTEHLRKILPGIFASLAVEVLLDAPCGDFNFLRMIDLDKVGIRKYIGIDIVEELILKNIERYRIENKREFIVGDIEKDSLPRVDCILCRDLLGHLTLDKGVRVIHNFRKTESRWLLATTYPDFLKENKDIRLGDWRPLDLSVEPFNLGRAKHIYNECSIEKTDFRQKSLGLWELSTVAILEKGDCGGRKKEKS